MGFLNPCNGSPVKKIDRTSSEAKQSSFELLKQRLVSAPGLGYSNITKAYILATYASGFVERGVGGSTVTGQDRKEWVIDNFSKTFILQERNYCATRQELLATVKAIKHFHLCLQRKMFRLRIDHSSLKWLCKRKELSNQVACCLEILAELCYTLEQQAGVLEARIAP